MNKKLFGELVESMTQMGGIVRGERKPSREFHVDSEMVKKLRAASGLSQPKFAALLRVDVGTLAIGNKEYASPAARQRRSLQRSRMTRRTS